VEQSSSTYVSPLDAFGGSRLLYHYDSGIVDVDEVIKGAVESESVTVMWLAAQSLDPPLESVTVTSAEGHARHEDGDSGIWILFEKKPGTPYGFVFVPRDSLQAVKQAIWNTSR
jgi:hypothetical protein